MRARLALGCADLPETATTVVGRLVSVPGTRVVEMAQYSSPALAGEACGRFFLRAELEATAAGFERLGGELVRLGSEPEIDYGLNDAATPKRIAILVSRYDHCLLDLLARWRDGELRCEIVAVCSNHPDLRGAVEQFGLPYVHVPVAGRPKAEAEKELLEALPADCELIVLARYMQILSAEFLACAPAPAINIHHSFLPAFAGADPYERARERGVKLIGATAHYVTAELDAGPIIEQGVERVSHSDDALALTRIGRDVERLVLARAVRWHLEDRVFRHQDRTIIL